MNVGPVRTLTEDERGRWGVCRVCLAESGEPCDPATEATSDHRLMTEGTHVARLKRAPFRVREVAA